MKDAGSQFTITRKSLHQELVDRLQVMIIGGELVPGAKVPEKTLCATFGVSRTPLREALKVLASDGLVRLEPNRGAWVTTVTVSEVNEVFPVLGALEALSQVETAEAYRLRAQALTGMNRIDEARETLRKGLDMPGDKGALYAEYAMFRLADGEIAEATRYVRLAEQSAPEALETYLAAGRLAQAQERIDDAIAIFGEGAEAYPTDLRLFEELAMALGQAGRFEEIEQLVEKGRARFGGTPEFTILRAKLAAEQGEWEQVRSLMQPIEAQLDNRPVAELLYATALYRLGQSELAYRRAQRLNRRFPGNPDAQSLLEEIEASL